MKYIISIPKPCDEKWHLMNPTDRGRFCTSCEKEVLDFTNTTTYRIANLLDNRENICGRFNKRQLNNEFSSNKNRGVQRTGLLFGITSLLALCTPVQAQHKTTVIEQQAVTMGKLAINPTPKEVKSTPMRIEGTIFDQNNLPLPAANIVLEGTAIGAISDYDGNFSMEIPHEVDRSKQYVVVSYLGFETQTICLDAFKKGTKIKLILSEDIMGEIVVVRRNIFTRIASLFKKKPKSIEEENEMPICDLDYEKVTDETEMIEIEESETPLRIETEKTPKNHITFWPNPVVNEFHLRYEMAKEGTFNVGLTPLKNHNATQISIVHDYREKGSYSETFQIRGLKNGIYVLTVRMNDKYEKHKMIVKNQ